MSVPFLDFPVAHTVLEGFERDRGCRHDAFDGDGARQQLRTHHLHGAARSIRFGHQRSAFPGLNGLLADFARITGEMLTGNDPTIRIKKVPSVPEGHA